MTIRGIGPIIVTALVVKQVEPQRSPNARQFAAYIGLVPDQHSGGRKIRLANRNLRIAWVLLQSHDIYSLDPKHGRRLQWLSKHNELPPPGAKRLQPLLTTLTPGQSVAH